MSQKLSVVIITYNEEKNIKRCLDSVVNIADEIIVVDSFSTDRTKEICTKYAKLKFVEHVFEGHIEQKNFAKTLTSYSLVLSLDADEALDKKLTQSILEVKANANHIAYKMNRLTNYCGQWIRHCGWYPDVKVRLFDKDAGAWGGNNPHDRFIPKKGITIKHLEGDILHYSYYTKEEHIRQIHKFSSIGAKALYAKGKSANWFKIYIKTIARFLKTLVVKKGFLDGKNGLRISQLSAYSNYLKYSKLLRLNQGNTI